MSEKFNFTPLAKEDLREIWNYTIDEWDEKQADKYISALYDRFEWLAENPQLGTKRNEIGEGYQSYFQAKHTIFYRVAGEEIEIIGIPNQNEDIIKHFEIDNLNTPAQNLLSEQTKPPFDEPDEELESTRKKTPEHAKDDLEL